MRVVFIEKACVVLSDRTFLEQRQEPGAPELSFEFALTNWVVTNTNSGGTS